MPIHAVLDNDQLIIRHILLLENKLKRSLVKKVIKILYEISKSS